MGSSWRDSASEQAQAQFDELVGASLEVAERMLRKHGEFIPFAVVWKAGAPQSELVMVVEDFDALPESPQVIEQTIAALRETRDDLDAAAVVVDVLVDGRDAVSVALEHREGTALRVLQPYRRKRLRGLELGELFAQAGDRTIWST